MPKNDLVSLSCDYCGNHDTFNVRESAEKILPIISKWKGVMDGDAVPGQADSHRWYCCRECHFAGEEKWDREKAEAIAEQKSKDEILARASNVLRMAQQDKAVTVGKA